MSQDNRPPSILCVMKDNVTGSAVGPYRAGVANGSSSPMSGPAACQNRDSSRTGGTGSRQSVTTLPVGTCHSRVNGMSASSPASAGQRLAVRCLGHQGHRDHQADDQRVRHDPAPQAPGRGRASSSAATASSITPSPRCASSSPSRTRSGSHASASTVPLRRTAAGAVTTGRQNSASSPDRGPRPPASHGPVPAEPQVTGRDHDRARRSARSRGSSRPGCARMIRHGRKHEGLLILVRRRQPHQYQEPDLSPKQIKTAAQSPVKQPHP